MTAPVLSLLCPVRDCHQALTLMGKSFVCSRGHSFDLARSGYANFLQPQERRSKQPGDSAAAVQARRRLHDRGVSMSLLGGITELLQPQEGEWVLDAGCGDGFYLGSIAQQSRCEGIGIDISTPAIDAAARRYPACHWFVANADRFVPCQTASMSAVLSITARMNPAEFRRVLRDGGRLLVAIPAEEDLIELRGVGRERRARTVEEFSTLFRLQHHAKVQTTAQLDATAVEDVGLSVYRPLSASSVRAMQVTFALDLLLFRPI